MPNVHQVHKEYLRNEATKELVSMAESYKMLIGGLVNGQNH